jgi:alcohol dehydrogenase class IV
MNNKLLALLPKLYCPGQIYWGNKSCAVMLKDWQVDNNLLVVSDHAWRAHQEWLTNFLRNNDTLIKQTGEPTDEQLQAVIKKGEGLKPQRIIAFGGGSTIDVGKLAGQKLQVPVIAIPTTLGSGAEVSQHAVLIDNHRKQVTSSPDLVPQVVLYDAKLLTSLAKQDIIWQALDALAHGLESLVSRLANPLTDTLAATSVEQLVKNLQELPEEVKPTDLENLQQAAMWAGLAQSCAATGLAHAFAHQLGPRLQISHSQAVARFLIDVVSLNREHGSSYDKLSVLASVKANTLLATLENLYTDLPLEFPRLSLKQDLDSVASDIKKDICTLSNPYQPSVEDIKAILNKHL